MIKYYLLICSLLPTLALAQETFTLSGKIQEKGTENGVPLATITAFFANDRLLSGTYSDVDGHFKIVLPDSFIGYLRLSCIGFKTKDLTTLSKKSKHQLDIIPLEKTDVALQEAVIEGNGSFTTYKIDKKVYELEKMPMNEGATASEAMDYIPSLEVDIDGNISLRGSSNFTVLMDGKPMSLTGDDLFAYLQSLPASVLKNIEIMTNPSAKYDPDGMAGIINIVTKTNKLQGVSGNVSTSVAQTGIFNSSGMLALKKGKFNTMLNIGVNLRGGDNVGSTLRSTKLTEDSMQYLDQNNDGEGFFAMAMARLSVGYKINEKTSLDFKGSYSYRDMNRDEINRYQFSDDIDQVYRKYDRETEGGGMMKPTSFGLNFSKDLKNKGQQIVLGANYSNFYGDFYSDFLELNYDNNMVRELSPSLKQRQNTIIDRTTWTFQADYNQTIFKKVKLEAGLKSILKNGKSTFRSEVFDFASQEWRNEQGLSNDFELDEGINSAYVQIKQQIKKFGYQLGLRGEIAYTDAKLIRTDNDFYNEYTSLFPSVHTSYWLPKKQQLKAGYSRRLNRPSGRMLNPFNDYSDPQNIRIGNPFLLPEYINSYEVEYLKYWKKNTFTASLYYKKINGMITKVKSVSEGVSIVSYDNIGSGVNSGVEASIQLNGKKWWTHTMSGNIFQTKIESDDSELNAEGYSFNLKWNQNFILPKEYTIQLGSQYRSPKVLAQGEISEMYWIDLSAAKKIWKGKATITAKLTDLLNTREYQFETEGINFYQESYRKRQSRFIWLGFSYNFGQFKNVGSRRGTSGDSGFDAGPEID